MRKLKETLRTRSVAQRKAMKASIVAAANFLMKKSLEIVPRQTEELAESAKVVKKETATQFTASVEYSAPHAIYVHENLEAAHGKEFNNKHREKIISAGQGDSYWFFRGDQEQAKYLETPARLYRSELKAIIKSGSKLP